MSWNTVIVIVVLAGYFIGTGLLNPASFYLFPAYSEPNLSIALFIAACGFLLVAAVIDIVAFAHAKCATAKSSDPPRDKRFGEERSRLLEEAGASPATRAKPVNLAVVEKVGLLLGGLFFEVASILYWPSFTTPDGIPVARIGTWVFRTGSCCYLMGSFATLHDLRHFAPRGTTLERWNFGLALGATWSYIVGALLYISGGVLSEAKAPPLYFASLWMCGSVLFFLGTCLLCVQYALSKCCASAATSSEEHQRLKEYSSVQ
ncbi:hypothetical protein QOT17_002932 [Balamuthia mandrillaris]